MANENGILYDVFISYSREDKNKADKLASYLETEGLKTWIDYSNISGGDRPRRKIMQGLQQSQTLIVLLSNSSIESDWVEAEWEKMLEQTNKENTPKVIPVLIEDCEIPLRLNTINYIDFRNVDFNYLEKSEDELLLLVDSIRGVFSPPGTTVISIPVAVVAMTRAEADELVSLDAFKEDNANKDQRNRFENFFNALIGEQLANFVDRYADNREKYRPFSSDNRTIREIIDDIIDLINETNEIGSKVIIRAQYHSNNFFSNSSDIRVKAWEYLDHHGCILILDGISMFHPKIQSKFLSSELGSKERASLVCISLLNPRDYEPNKILEYEIKERLQRAFVRYHQKLDPKCSFEVGDERALVRWLYSILPGVAKTVQKQKANPMMREYVRNSRGQPAGIHQSIYREL